MDASGIIQARDFSCLFAQTAHDDADGRHEYRFLETSLGGEPGGSQGLAREWVKALFFHSYAETLTEDYSIVIIKKTSSIARRGFLLKWDRRLNHDLNINT